LEKLKSKMEVIQKEEQRILDSIQLLEKKKDTSAIQTDSSLKNIKRKLIDSLGMAPAKYSIDQ